MSVVIEREGRRFLRVIVEIGARVRNCSRLGEVAHEIKMSEFVTEELLQNL